MDKMAVNVTVFIQPAFVYEMLNLVPDTDCVNDRQLFNFPQSESSFLMILRFQCHQIHLISFNFFYEIYKNHKDEVVYTLEGDAYQEYRSTHDLLNEVH